MKGFVRKKRRESGSPPASPPGKLRLGSLFVLSKVQGAKRRDIKLYREPKWIHRAITNASSYTQIVGHREVPVNIKYRGRIPPVKDTTEPAMFPLGVIDDKRRSFFLYCMPLGAKRANDQTAKARSRTICTTSVPWSSPIFFCRVHSVGVHPPTVCLSAISWCFRGGIRLRNNYPVSTIIRSRRLLYCATHC